MEKLMLRELLEATGGTLLSGDKQSEKADRQETEILSVVTDSRKIIPGCVFFALSGERFDGHAYVSSALEKGAAGCIISRAPEKIRPDRFYILVKDTRRALGDLAHYYRKKHDVKVVGITG
ncbi:MAG TPA: UDP-N-acetylmuramoyl-tripeptide--D-alanyl-D-alanine ligase, partial [Sarcina sp.]|nr:UDP-N-acetylmuramoyl-tripeptide--D-alanyl-D-alanine ligase [Sarcina sp.]